MAEDDERRKVDKSVEREFSQQRNDQSILLDALEGLSAGMSPVQPSPAIAKPRRDRTVSWDINVPADLIDAPPNHDLSPVTPPQSSNVTTGKLSLKDIKDSSPIEDEAESYIHRALEESDPTRSGESEAQKNLLGAEVPKYRFEDAPSSPVPSTSSKASQKSHVSKSHRKTLSTGDALFNLAAEMRQMQNQSVSESFDGVKNGTTSADMFATNAIALMKRNKAKKEEETKSAAAVAAVRETFDPASKWKKLRTAVRASNMVDSKKTDEAVDPLENDDGDQQVDLESGVSGKGETKQNSSDNLRRSKKKSQINEDFKSDFQDFEEWLKFRKGNALRFVKNVLFFIIFPATGIAAILFYLADNPPCGSQEECIAEQHPVDVKTPMPVANTTDPGDSGLGSIGNFFRVDRSNQASASFWILFIGVRQVITFSLAKMSQAVVIDFFALRTRLFVKVLGPYATLWTVQSRGWPFLLTWWVLYDFFLLFGNNKFARHWLFWQDTIGLFNFENPAGGVLNSKAYQTVLILAASIGVAITAKRFWVGLFLGRQTFDRYANDLAVIMRKALLVGQIATLARDMEKYDFSMNDYHVEHSVAYKKTMEQNVAELDGGESVGSGGNASKSQRSILASTVDYNASIRVKINEVLGAWEEPTLLDKSNDIVSISSIIQFRQSLSCLNTTFPFSVAFGPADSRTTCISSVETVYQRLLGRTPSNEALNFDVLALVAVDRDGSLDEAKLKEVVKIFRPDREGNLSLIDFAKSVDSVYKELRLLRASVANSSKMDKAFERIINILFYFIVGCISLGVMGVDPLALFGSVSAFVLGFAFMIGAACSKYFEGLLLILVRRPFDIGDRIHVSDVNNDTSFSGSPTWFVRDVTLFATTVVFAATNEVATYSNGSLASSRIINAARSPQAVLYFNLKFPINTPYSKFKIFKAALEKFVKARPRQWLSFSAFRATRVEADAGFVEYIVVGQHRESWQNVGALLDSKAELSSFALELSKRMNMRYRAPPLPVDLSMRAAGNGGPLNDMLAQQMQAGDQFGSSDGDGANEDGSQSTYDIGAIESMFEKPK